MWWMEYAKYGCGQTLEGGNVRPLIPVEHRLSPGFNNTLCYATASLQTGRPASHSNASNLMSLTYLT